MSSGCVVNVLVSQTLFGVLHAHIVIITPLLISGANGFVLPRLSQCSAWRQAACCMCVEFQDAHVAKRLATAMVYVVLPRLS
jgi:hypothetical protein